MTPKYLRLWYGLLLIWPASLPAQPEQRDNARLKEQIAARQFTFRMQFIRPLSGPQLNRSGDGYRVTVRDSVLDCYLPYIGVAYMPPADPMDVGLKFTTRKFRFELRNRKKGRMEVSIRPEQGKDIVQLYFFITPDGDAQLQVTRATAQGIEYAGTVTGND